VDTSNGSHAITEHNQRAESVKTVDATGIWANRVNNGAGQGSILKAKQKWIE
jgi:hypothetical protein